MLNRSEIFSLPKSIFLEESVTAEAFTFDYFKHAYWLYRNRLLNLDATRAKEAPSWLLCTAEDASSYHAGLCRICDKYGVDHRAGKQLIDLLDYIHGEIALEQVAVRTRELILNFDSWDIEIVYGRDIHLAFATRCVYY